MSQLLSGSGVMKSGGSGPQELEPTLLRKARIFEDLDDAVLRRLVRCSDLLSAEDDTVLCRQGERADKLFVLLEGQVTLTNTAPNGTSAVVEVIQPGGHFVLATLLARLPLLMTARATASSRLIGIEGDGLLALIQEEQAVATAVMRAEALDFRALVRQVCDLKLRTTAQRLGCYLLELSNAQHANTATLRLPFDKRLLAAKLGCRQENLSRAFAALRSFGVETHGARVILHDIARLRAYSVPDALDDATPA